MPFPQAISVEQEHLKAALGSYVPLAGLNEDLMTQNSAVQFSVCLQFLPSHSEAPYLGGSRTSGIAFCGHSLGTQGPAMVPS